MPNRRLLGDRIRQALAHSQRSREYGALMLLDLDNFKVLNDTQGHDVGDRMLQEVARRLTAPLRENDTVARLGGDEFVVLVQELGTTAHEASAYASLVAEKIRDALNLPYDLDGYQYLSSCSVGVTLFLGEDENSDSLFKHADLALYQAKAAGRNTIRFFDPAMQNQLEMRVVLQDGLRDALQQSDGLQLYYQPQVDSAGVILGVEGLLRWFEKSGKNISPQHFIPVAEETGQILQLGQWVLETGCARLQAWSTKPVLSELTLSLNISARQFGHPNFVQQVQAALSRFGIAPGRLVLELTESCVLHDVHESIERMKTLKASGVLFSLDDFGTGYSSLSYLKRLPVDEIKIDQSFVRDVVDDPEDAAIVRAIIGLGETLDIEVIAEGVETREQQHFLEHSNCRAFQGYLFGRPMPASDFEAFALRQISPATNPT